MIPVSCIPYLFLVFNTSATVFGDVDWGPVAAAQLEQESSCNPLAQSPYASGLMQFTPGTASDMENGICKDLGKAKLFDPRWSIVCGTRYANYLYKKTPNYKPFFEHFAATLSAYNGGLGWVNRDNRICKKLNWCNQSKWFDHVEKTPDLRRAGWAISENRQYVDYILKKRINKYYKYWELY